MVYECLIFEQQLLTKRYLILFHLLSLDVAFITASLVVFIVMHLIQNIIQTQF